MNGKSLVYFDYQDIIFTRAVIITALAGFVFLLRIRGMTLNAPVVTAYFLKIFTDGNQSEISPINQGIVQLYTSLCFTLIIAQKIIKESNISPILKFCSCVSILVLIYASFSSINVIGESSKELVKYKGKINILTQFNSQTTNKILSLKSVNQDERKTIIINLENLFAFPRS